MWAGHDSMICSMLYGEVWQYSHGLPIFSIVGAPNLALLILLLSFLKLILFFPILGTIAWNFLPFVLPSHFFCHSSILCLLIMLYISFFLVPCLVLFRYLVLLWLPGQLFRCLLFRNVLEFRRSTYSTPLFLTTAG